MSTESSEPSPSDGDAGVETTQVSEDDPPGGGWRTEHDSLGSVQVPADRLWGAQTQRSIGNFAIGRDRYVWGRTVVESVGMVKKAAALANADTGALDAQTADLIVAAADEVVDGRHDSEFPLVVFQTGSGTQTNMNANEVIANRANQIAAQLGAVAGASNPNIHPNDHVNASQSSNDVFPTLMHVAILLLLHRRLYPVVDELVATLDRLGGEHRDLVKVGRTHLQDATPITFGQELDAWAAQIRDALAMVRHLEPALHEIALGGTATGTGLNTPPGFAPAVARRLTDVTGIVFTETGNHLAATAAHDAIVTVHAAIRTLAGALMKLANDIRWLASGPRAGIGELRIPANEPGSSMMPGKTNPTQAEALTMVAAHVFGNDTTVAFAGTQGHFQLNTYKPLILDRILDSIDLLADAAGSFDAHCLAGIEPDRERMAEHVESNLMVVTALVPIIGYDRAAEIANIANRDGLTIRGVADSLDYLANDRYDESVDQLAMTRPHGAPPRAASPTDRARRDAWTTKPTR